LQRLLKPQHGRKENIDVSCFDLLQCPGMQVDFLSQLFLGEAQVGPMSANIEAEGSKLQTFFGF
jgi:hypothetical protein